MRKIVNRASSVESAPAAPTCTVVLEEETSTDVWTARQTESYTGTGYISGAYYEAEPGFDGWYYTARQSLGGSFTFTDNQQVATDRTYRLRLSARSIAFGGIDNPYPAVPSIDYTDSQRLSLVSSE